LNIHASLLPRWRGAAPIPRAIEAGDEKSGITIMQMDVGLDTGDILAQYPITLSPSETGHSLHDTLATLGASAIVEVVNELQQYQNNALPQQGQFSNYAKKISKQESNINWSESSEAIARRIRAFNPWPGSQTCYHETKLRLFKAEHSLLKHEAEPGTILSSDKTGIQIACGIGVLIIKELQRPGGKALPVADFLNGMTLLTGEKLKQGQDA
jgi:methionyl-tRNA formyltransferase